MQELKSPRGLLAALIVIAVACSLFHVANRRFSADTASEISPKDRLNAFLASYVGAQVLVQVPLEVPGYVASISLYDYFRYRRWHHLAGEKVVTLLIRSKKTLAENGQTTQRAMIDLGHDGSLEFFQLSPSFRDDWAVEPDFVSAFCVNSSPGDGFCDRDTLADPVRQDCQYRVWNSPSARTAHGQDRLIAFQNDRRTHVVQWTFSGTGRIRVIRIRGESPHTGTQQDAQTVNGHVCSEICAMSQRQCNEVSFSIRGTQMDCSALATWCSLDLQFPLLLDCQTNPRRLLLRVLARKKS